MAAISSSFLFAQELVPNISSDCANTHRKFAPKNPRLGDDGRFVIGQSIRQLKFPLDHETTIQVLENPSTRNNTDYYNSVVIVQRRQERKRYPLRNLITNGAFYRIVEIASFCPSPEKRMLFLAFETPSIGVSEAFAIISSAPEEVSVQAFPVAEEGRIIINKADPAKVELWSATASAHRFDCDGCQKYYSITDCNVKDEAISCKQRRGPRTIGSPAKFIYERITIR